MTMMVGSEHLVIILIGLETLSLSLYVLAGGFRERGRSLEAALKYFLLGAFASGFLIYGMALLYGATGTFHLRVMGRVLAERGEAVSGSLLLLAGLVLALIGLAFKVAAVPFHTWCPDVYQGAPAPITAFMAAGTKAAAFAVLVRMVSTTLGVEGLTDLAASWKGMLTLLAILTMTGGNLLALVQYSIKRMLAYSSIAHAGYLLIAVVALLDTGDGAVPGVATQALSFYLVSYAFMTMGAFLVVARISRGGQDADHLSHYAGLAARRPVLALVMGLFMISLIGIPPTGGFVGKYYLFLAAMEGKLYLLATVGVLNAVVAAAYYLRVVVTMYMKPPEPELTPAGGRDRSTALALGLAVAGTLILGLWPGPVLDWAAGLHAGLPVLDLLAGLP
jgi:NADH-quinone oxidoreductase subunit N